MVALDNACLLENTLGSRQPRRSLWIAVVVAFLLCSAALADVKAPADAMGVDWPKIFGPTDDAVCTETNLTVHWPTEGPPVLWRKKLGSSYSAPSIAKNQLVVFHRLEDEEVVECLDPATERSFWTYKYPTTYVDRYGYNNGPRCTPIIEEGKVYTYGAEGKLHCLDLEKGGLLWKRDLNLDYKVEQGFFGVGASPILKDGQLLINVGGKETNAGIVGIDAATGKTKWTATSQGASYATPRIESIHDRPYAFVFTEAGLVSLLPKSGKVLWTIPFRSKIYESVNATTPLIAGDLVFVSATYGTGALCLRIKESGEYEELWRNKTSLDSHFSNMIAVDGYVYGYAGRHEGGSDLRCVNLETGEVMWKWDTALARGSMVRVGEHLILWGERGHLVSLKIDPTKPVPVAFTEQPLLRWPCWTPPAIAHGRLYLRDETNLLCLDLRKPENDEKKK